jgi:hypothetical protein
MSILKLTALVLLFSYLALPSHTSNAGPEEELPLPPLQPIYAPKLQKTKAVWNNDRIQALLKWKPSKDALRYQIQLSRSVTFSRLLVNKRTNKPRYFLRSLKPCLFFWRVRVIDRFGGGPFSTARMLDASQFSKQFWQNRSKKSLIREKLRALITKNRMPVEEDGVLLDWLEPPPDSISTMKKITIGGKTHPGTIISVGDSSIKSKNGIFTLDIELKPGKNIITVTASRRGLKKAESQTLYYLPPIDLAKFKTKYAELNKQLFKFQIVQAELQHSIRLLQHRLQNAQDTPQAAELKKELEEIEKVHSSLDDEIENVMEDIKNSANIMD